MTTTSGSTPHVFLRISCPFHLWMEYDQPSPYSPDLANSDYDIFTNIFNKIMDFLDKKYFYDDEIMKEKDEK